MPQLIRRWPVCPLRGRSLQLFILCLKKRPLRGRSPSCRCTISRWRPLRGRSSSQLSNNKKAAADRSCSQQLFPVVTFLRRRQLRGRSCFQFFKRDYFFFQFSKKKRLIIYYCFQFKKTAAAVFMLLRSNCPFFIYAGCPKKSGRFASVVVLSCPIIIVTHFQMMSVAPTNSKVACF